MFPAVAASAEDGRTVAATVVFTDLVGSTELSTRLSAAAADEVRRTHFELLRRAIDAHGGTEVKNLGDGIMAVFPSVGSALDASVSIQQEAHRHNEDHAEQPLRIRVGVATGDCVAEDGDYFGEPVIQAARLCNAADGAEILVAEVVRLSAPRGHYRFDRLGPLELKGIPEAVDVAKLQWSPPEPARPTAVPLPDRLAVAHPLPYVGRIAERERLGDAFKEARSGARQIVLVAGEAGQGKTRLAAELARSAHDDGALVLYGRCDDQMPLPYGPWAQALQHWVRHSVSDAQRPGGEELDRLMPELLGTSSGSAERTTSDQHALYTALTSLLLELSDSHPVLIVLDDLQWADRDSLLLVRHVAGHLLSGEVMLLGTYRDTDLHDGHPLEDLLAALRRETGVTRLNLEGLTPREIESMVSLSIPAANADDHLVETLAEETGGNPFFLGELLWHLSESGLDAAMAVASPTATDGPSSLALPESVREVVIARVNALGERATRALTTASVIGREFDVQLLADLVETGQDELIDIIDGSVGAGLLDEVDDSGDRLAFSHALVRRVLNETLSKRRRVVVHRSIVEAMDRHAGSGRFSAAQLAYHWQAAQPPGGDERLLELMTAAGADARHQRAPEEAIVWFSRALELVEKNTEEECDLMVLLGEAQRLAGHPEHRSRLLRAAHLAQQLGRDDLLVAAVLANHRGFQSGAGMVDEERIEVARRALDVVDTSPADRARLLVLLATELPADDPARHELAVEAVEVARGCGDEGTLVDVIALGLTVLVAPEQFEQAAALSAEAMALTATAQDPNRRMQVLFAEQAVQLILGEVDEAARCAAEYEQLVGQLGQPVRLWTAALRSAILSTVLGDYAAAQNRMEAALELGLATGQPDAFVSYGALVMGMAIHQGRTDELIALTLEAAEQNPGLPILRAGAAAFLAEAGRPDEAAAALASLGDLETTLPPDHFWLASLVLLADAATRLGDRRTSSVLFHMLEPYGERIAVHPAGCLGAVSLALGQLASTLGRDDAPVYLQDSLERHERLRSPYYRARSHLALADWDPAHLDAAAELSARHGFAGIERELNDRRQGQTPDSVA